MKIFYTPTPPSLLQLKIITACPIPVNAFPWIMKQINAMAKNETYTVYTTPVSDMLPACKKKETDKQSEEQLKKKLLR